MGRRSFISMTTINRLISASNQRAREREREELIRSQSAGIKETAPVLTLEYVEFNPNTRLTKIEFLQTQNYRTITKYVTQNYAKYPIYSNWKTRTKTIKKSIKLTNEELENLPANADYDIRKFASEIILKLNNPDLLPSWFLKQVNLEAYREKIEILNNDYKEFWNDCNDKMSANSSTVKNIKSNLVTVREELTQKKRQSKILETKVNKINSAKKSPLKYLFSFFIYTYFVSQKRKHKLETKLKDINRNIDTLNNVISRKETEIKDLKNENQVLQETITQHKSELEKKTKEEYNELSKQQKQITPLPTTVETDTAFVPLKTFSGLTYSKIIGCYIIRNTNNDKYYVGQSKDVIKRLKQHFKGTVPNNIIFAEDYYSASPEIRDKLFEVKILPCSTKDELDRTEKELIEKYSSFATGYNGTSGNN